MARRSPDDKVTAGNPWASCRTEMDRSMMVEGAWLRSTRRCTSGDPSRPSGRPSAAAPATYVPLPGRRPTRPSATKSSKAATVAPRLTNSAVESARSEGMRNPSAKVPLSMAAATARAS